MARCAEYRRNALRGLRCLISLVAVIACGAAPAFTQQRDDTSKLDLSTVQQRASAGDTVAENELGMRYLSGTGVKQDPAAAAGWFQKAADQGDAVAETNLGYLYVHGNGVRQDYSQAVSWFTKAADQGQAFAQEYLGILYEEGTATPRDLAKALTLFRKSADQGLGMAENSLGTMYARGEGVPKDEAQAVVWLRKAADQDDATAEMNLAFLYENGSQIPRDYEQALALFRKAAAHGNAQAQHFVGIMYFKGQGVPQDYGQAAMWFRGAADQGEPGAETDLGICYEQGNGVPQDLAEARKWLQKAAGQGMTAAKAELAKMDGPTQPKTIPEVVATTPGRPAGTPGAVAPTRPAPSAATMANNAAQKLLKAQQALKDGDDLAGQQKYEAAFSKYLDAQLGGDPQTQAVAELRMGMLYADGNGFLKDKDKAAHWLGMSADLGNPDAKEALAKLNTPPPPAPASTTASTPRATSPCQTDLASLQQRAEAGDAGSQNCMGYRYYLGQGVAQDYTQAYAWYRKSADQGNPIGQLSMGRMNRVGQGVAQDYGQALVWFRKAAEQGNASAQQTLGFMYIRGEGTPKDYAEARVWLEKAAEQGNRTAKSQLEEVEGLAIHVPLNAGTDMHTLKPAEALSIVFYGNTLQIERPTKEETQTIRDGNNAYYKTNDFQVKLMNQRIQDCDQAMGNMDFATLSSCKPEANFLQFLPHDNPKYFEALYIVCYWGNGCGQLGEAFMKIGNVAAARAIWEHAPGCHAKDDALQPFNGCMGFVLKPEYAEAYSQDQATLKEMATAACRNELDYASCYYLHSQGDTSIDLDAVGKKDMARLDASWKASEEQEAEREQIAEQQEAAKQQKMDAILGLVGTITSMGSSKSGSGSGGRGSSSRAGSTAACSSDGAYTNYMNQCRSNPLSQAPCYRAAAALCQCYVNADPTNPSVGSWRQCVSSNTASANSLLSNAPTVR